MCKDAGMPPRPLAVPLLAAIACLSACGDDGRTEQTLSCDKVSAAPEGSKINLLFGCKTEVIPG